MRIILIAAGLVVSAAVLAVAGLLLEIGGFVDAKDEEGRE
jgi:hypothetical protein